MKIQFHLFNKHYLIKLLAAFAILISTTSHGEILFTDNYDATPDWQNVGSQRCNWLGGTNCGNVPLNYDLMYVTDKNKTSPMCQITSAAGKGLSGKGIRLSDESNGDRNSWGSDCQIEKYLYKQYPEIWVSYYIRYNSNMIWESGSRTSKILRIGHYNPLVIDGTARTSTFNTNNNSKKNNGLGDTTAGVFFLYLKHDSDKLVRFQQGVRCGGTYKCGSYDEAWFQNMSGTTGNSWKETFGDNKWHHIEARVKMNSSVGAKDGVLELYFDGVRQTKRNDIPWRLAGTKKTVTGFNMVSIGGNTNNVWAGQTNEEQWMYDFDNLRICTSRCPSPGSAPKPPAKITVQ